MLSINTWQPKILVSLIVLLICCIFPLGFSLTQGSTSVNSPPAIQWEQQYGDTHTASVSNIIQTSDGGYAFIDLGFIHSITISPSVIYKINDSGNLTWQKRIENFLASSFFETNDGGYQVFGAWATYGSIDQYTPALIKFNRNGNIEWTQNTTQSNQNINNQPLNETHTSPTINTSDGGYAYAVTGAIVKIGSTGEVEWVKNVTYSYDYPHTKFPLSISYLLESSDGSIVGIGTGSGQSSWLYGNIYLIKTEAFLPLPSAAPPLPTPLPNEATQKLIPLMAAIFVVTIVIVATIIVVAKRSHRKTMPV